MNIKAIALFFALALFAACGSDKGTTPPVAEDIIKKDIELSPEQRMQADVQAFINKEVKNARKITDILTGFTFGMSKDAVDDHTTKMMKKGTLKKVKVSSSKYEYVYQFPLGSKAKADTYMEAAYTQGGLYKMTCNLKTPTGMGTADALVQTKAHLVTLYGEPAFTLPSYNSCDHYLWIGGNMHIDLKCELSGVQFVYTDLTEEKPVPQFNNIGTQVEVTTTTHEGH